MLVSYVICLFARLVALHLNDDASPHHLISEVLRKNRKVPLIEQLYYAVAKGLVAKGDDKVHPDFF